MALCALAEVSNLPLAPPGARIGNTSFPLRWNERDTTINTDVANETGSWHAVQSTDGMAMPNLRSNVACAREKSVRSSETTRRS